MTQDEQKRAAASAAVDLIQPGMRLGLGTGSTAAMFVDMLGKRVADGLEVICVPTSKATHAQAEALGIPLTTLDETPELDLTVDGADELDDQLNLIKGGGGALLREKIVAASSAHMAVISDQSKHVKELGKFPLPIEVVPFGHASTAKRIARAAASADAGGQMVLRQKDGADFITDNGNLIYDCHFGHIVYPKALALALQATPGVVEHGLFIGLARAALIGGPDGIKTLSV